MAAKSLEERLSILDEKIAQKQAEIDNLMAQKEKLVHPVSIRTVMAKAKEAGMTPRDIAEKLGLDV